MNRKMTTGAPELHPIPVKSPWYHIGIYVTLYIKDICLFDNYNV